MKINPWIKDRAVFSGVLAQGRKELQQQIDILTRRYNETGGVIHVCQPAFAVGCETSSNVRSLIRRDQRLSLG